MFLFFLLKIFVESKCSGKSGSYVLRFKIHMDEYTLSKILLINKNKEKLNRGEGKRDVIIDYINTAFNEVNQAIEDYGVQVMGDYSALNFDDLETNLDMEKLCLKRVMAIESYLRLTSKLSYPNTDGLGLRIVAMTCKASGAVQIPFFTLPSLTCGNLGFIFVLDTYTLIVQLKFIIKSFISGGVGALFPIKSSMFEKSLCNFANKCAVNNGVLGSFIPNLEKIVMERN